MKVVRTFHPVGQGAFYSERFYNMDNPQAKFNIVNDCGTSWGTIQLPHHGSLKSFDVNKNHIDRRYYFPMSCGSTNSYGHPSGKVLAYLQTRDGLPQIVTEAVNTVCMQEIERF